MCLFSRKQSYIKSEIRSDLFCQWRLNLRRKWDKYADLVGCMDKLLSQTCVNGGLQLAAACSDYLGVFLASLPFAPASQAKRRNYRKRIRAWHTVTPPPQIPFPFPFPFPNSYSHSRGRPALFNQPPSPVSLSSQSSITHINPLFYTTF